MGWGEERQAGQSPLGGKADPGEGPVSILKMLFDFRGELTSVQLTFTVCGLSPGTPKSCRVFVGHSDRRQGLQRIPQTRARGPAMVGILAHLETLSQEITRVKECAYLERDRGVCRAPHACGYHGIVMHWPRQEVWVLWLPSLQPTPSGVLPAMWGLPAPNG